MTQPLISLTALPLGDGFRVRLGDPFGDIRVKKVIGHVFLRNWNERVDELRVFIQQAAIVVAVVSSQSSTRAHLNVVCLNEEVFASPIPSQQSHPKNMLG